MSFTVQTLDVGYDIFEVNKYKSLIDKGYIPLNTENSKGHLSMIKFPIFNDILKTLQRIDDKLSLLDSRITKLEKSQ